MVKNLLSRQRNNGPLVYRLRRSTTLGYIRKYCSKSISKCWQRWRANEIAPFGAEANDRFMEIPER